MADVFGALSDPTRRHLFQTLASSGSLTATSLSADLAISRQAVSKHLGILVDAGMATSTRVGRETRFEADVTPLGDVTAWVRSVESQWDTRLHTLSTSLGDKRQVERGAGD